MAACGQLGLEGLVAKRLDSIYRPGRRTRYRLKRKCPAWREFDAWMKANNHEKAESLWELYSVGPQLTPDPANWRTELNRPLKT